MSNSVGWFEIYVQDLDRAKNFYEKVFDKNLEKLPVAENGPKVEMYSFPMDENSYGAPGAICKMEGVSSGNGGTLVYFNCEDCSVEEGRVNEAGGEIQASKFSIGQYGFISIVKDTEGNTIGLHSRV